MKKHKNDHTDDNGDPVNAFGEMLAVMDIEQLIRFRHRLKKIGRKRMCEILSDEIEERNALEKKEKENAKAR
jgi:hypothetical protein